MFTFIATFFQLLIEMAPYLLFGFLITGALHVFVPRVFYRNYLSGNNFRSVFWAAMLGVPLPLCSCGVIPTAMSLRKEGASGGATASFLISTPQTGVDSILATGALLGWPYAMIRPLIALLTGWAAGILVNKMVPGDSRNRFSSNGEREPDADVVANMGANSDSVADSESFSVAESGKLSTAAGNSGEAAGCCAQNERLPITADKSQASQAKSSFGEKVREMFQYGFIDMIRDIGKWLTLGLILAALITAAVPDDFFAQFSDKPFLGSFVVLLLSIPMYVCATGSIPVAAALIAKGFSPGAAFVLLMAGPATNMAAVLVVGKVLGRKTLIIYLATIIAGALLGGAFIDGACPPEWFAAPTADFAPASCHTTGFWFKTVCGAVLTGLLFYALAWPRLKRWFAANGARGSEDSSGPAEGIERNETREKSTRKTTFKITGMTCSHCQAYVERTIQAIPGVESVVVSLDCGEAQVSGDAAPELVIKAVSDAGYGIELKPE